MTTRSLIARWSLPTLFVVGGLFAYRSLAAQTPSIRGRVLDSASLAVSDQRVALHRVTAEGGARIAEARTDSDGRFEFVLDADTADAVYFAATRYDGELYIGRPFRLPPPDADEDHLIRVGGDQGRVPLEAFSPGAAGAARVTGGGGWIASAGAIFAAGLLLLVGWRVQARPPEERRVLAGLARIDEQLASASADTPARDVEQWRQDRQGLAQRLRRLTPE